MTSRPTIVHYDFADIRYSSFFTTGFVLNAPLYGYRFLLSREPPPLLAGSTMTEEWRSVHPDQARCTFLYQFKSDSEDFYFCIDTTDSSCAFHRPLLEKVRFYFKVNRDPNCVAQDSTLVAHAHKIKPILPFFPLRSGNRLVHVPRLLPYRPMAWDTHSVLRRIIDTPRIPSLEALKLLRGGSDHLDVFFVSSYYPEPIHDQAMAFRYKLMEELDRQGFRRSVYGFASKNELPEPFRRYSMKWFSFSDYVRNLAGSRLAIYVRGLFECTSFKFGEYLALGLPVVGQTVANNRESLTGLPHFDEQFAFDEPRDIALQAATMLRQGERRHMLGESNAHVFDTMLSPEAVTGDALELLGLRRNGA